jgi:hypothetical protein
MSQHESPNVNASQNSSFIVRIIRSGSVALALIALGWALGFC